jgi:hypothetical protein
VSTRRAMTPICHAFDQALRRAPARARLSRSVLPDLQGEAKPPLPSTAERSATVGRERNQAAPGFGAWRAKLGRRGESGIAERHPNSAVPPDTPARLRDGTTKLASELARGDIVIVSAGELIPGDGVVIEGVAMVEESGITGESAPVMRESGTDRSAVSAGTHVITNQLVVEIT